MTTETKVWTGDGDTITEFTAWLGRNCITAIATVPPSDEFDLMVGNDNAGMRLSPGSEIRVTDYGPDHGRFLYAGPFSCKMEPPL